MPVPTQLMLLPVCADMRHDAPASGIHACNLNIQLLQCGRYALLIELAEPSGLHVMCLCR
jgi:hypothetical protein